MNLLKKFHLPNEAVKLLVLLLAADLFYIVLHIIHIIVTENEINNIFLSDAFRLSRDRAMAESFQYVKEYWIFLTFIWLMIKQKNFSFFGWALLFIYLLFDDMVGHHELSAESWLEKMGRNPFKEILGLRLQDFGELGFLLVIGVIFLIYFAVVYYRANFETRTVFLNLGKILLIIIFFGVFFDFIGHLIEKDPFTLKGGFVDLIEDGGEMIGMSIMCWYVYTLTEPIHDNPTIDSVK